MVSWRHWTAIIDGNTKIVVSVSHHFWVTLKFLHVIAKHTVNLRILRKFDVFVRRCQWKYVSHLLWLIQTELTWDRDRDQSASLYMMSNLHTATYVVTYGLFTLPDPDSDPNSNTDSCTMQKFHIGSDPDSDPLIEMYGIGTDICP